MKQSENHYKISSGLKFIYQTNQIIFIFEIYVTFGRDIYIYIEVCYETEIT